VLLDTSGLLCYHHRDEPQHGEAVRLLDASTRCLTHSYVLAEFLALTTARRLPRAAALAFVVDLLAHPDIETVWVDEQLNERALALLLARTDKSYSLCDAVSFVLMRERGIRDALTTDRHFEQEGLRRLLTP
jgi:uncharacterized protein